MPDKIIASFLFFLFPLLSFSQTDMYPGTWEMQYNANKTLPVSLELKIANPEKELLYPAQLKLQCGDFTGIYHLLLVKKNRYQLAISRNKYPLAEGPFTLGTWTVFLNNLFNYSKATGGSFLTLNRLSTKKYGIAMPDVIQYSEADRPAAIVLRDLLQNAPLQLKKKDPFPWRDAPANIVEHTGPNYYGVMDSIHVKSPTAKLVFADNKKNDGDTVSATLNGKWVADEIDIRRKQLPAPIELEKGLNLLAFFADNYGKTGVNAGKATLLSGNKKIPLDFNTRDDMAATFIVARVYYHPGNEDSVELVSTRLKEAADRTLERSIKPVGGIETKSEQITLALWDDAVEDGDSISLNINGKWIARGFAVKKRTQFIQVTLEPGPNKIIFIADNLGAIIPNTSVLEIIDGKQRKSFKIETNFDKNNLINIFYDFNPER